MSPIAPPFSRDCHAHTTYIRNLTEMMGYLETPSDREALLKTVIDRLVQLDAHLPNLLEEEEEDDEDDEGEEEMFAMESAAAVGDDSDASIARRNLDAAMVIMFEYVESRKPQKLYPELLPAFESHVLPAYATGHVQFLLFRLLSLEAEERKEKKSKLTPVFLNWLWQKFTNPNTPGILRQSCVAYVASLIARAKFVGLKVAQVS